jgi:dimeric dUTPase (all-alpha-NTP-PPase superfamily)
MLIKLKPKLLANMAIPIEKTKKTINNRFRFFFLELNNFLNKIYAHVAVSSWEFYSLFLCLFKALYVV